MIENGKMLFKQAKKDRHLSSWHKLSIADRMLVLVAQYDEPFTRKEYTSVRNRVSNKLVGKQAIQYDLKNMQNAGYIERIGYGEYQITNAGRQRAREIIAENNL